MTRMDSTGSPQKGVALPVVIIAVVLALVFGAGAAVVWRTRYFDATLPAAIKDLLDLEKSSPSPETSTETPSEASPEFPSETPSKPDEYTEDVKGATLENGMGSSTHGGCQIDDDCYTSGCNEEICQSRNEQPSYSACVVPDEPTPKQLGYQCKCLSRECQWVKP